MEEFMTIEIGDRLDIRYMNGTAIAEELPTESETIQVKFDGGAWDGRSLNLIRIQIAKVN